MSTILTARRQLSWPVEAVDASANAAGSGWGQAQTAKAGDNLVLVAA